jgi:hypothetical protein
MPMVAVALLQRVPDTSPMLHTLRGPQGAVCRRPAKLSAQVGRAFAAGAGESLLTAFVVRTRPADVVLLPSAETVAAEPGT